MKNVTNEIFAAVEGGAIAALEGQTGPQAAQLKGELEKLSAADVEEMKSARISPLKWAEIFVTGLALGKKLRDLIRESRRLP